MKSIGQEFAEQRRIKNLTIEEVAKSTKIRADFLKAIEIGDFNKLPSSTYAYGFVRNYAKFLGLPVEKSLAIYRREFDEKKSIEVLPRGFVNTKEFKPKRFRIGRSLIMLSFIVLVISGFLFYQYRSAFFNPKIDIDYPKENEVVNSLTFEVKGKTDPNGTLTIDSRQVAIEGNGNFKKQVTVFPGSTKITLRVQNQFGRTTTIVRNITVK